MHLAVAAYGKSATAEVRQEMAVKIDADVRRPTMSVACVPSKRLVGSTVYR